MNAPKFQIRPGAWVAAFNRHYPAFLNFLYGLGDVLTTTAQTLIVSFGVPALLMLLLWVEHARVKHGIELFEVNPSIADLAAWALVFSNAALPFLMYYKDSREGYQQPHRAAFSLRIFASDFRYWLGVGKWQPRPLPPSHEIRRVLRLVTFSILTLALLGSMADAMAQQTGAWYQGIFAIVTQSSLIDFSTWLGGLLFTVAAVFLVHVTTHHIARSAAEVAATHAQQDAAPARPDRDHGQDAPPAIVAEDDTQPTPAIVAEDDLVLVGSQDFLSPVQKDAPNSTGRRTSGRGQRKRGQDVQGGQ